MEIEKRMQWYMKVYHVKKLEINDFSYEKLYEKMLNKIKKYEFFVSKLKKKCKCEKNDICDCDTENYDKIKLSIIIHSNCNTSFEIKMNNKIGKNIRIFYLTEEDEEIKFCDIYKNDILIFEEDKKIKYKLDKNVISNSAINLYFNYMNFEIKK